MSVTLRRPGAAPATERVTVLSCDRGPAVRGEPDAALVARVHELARLPFVAHVLALPDLHQKGNAEVPSSLAVVTRDAIVPEFTSVAINDGMGVVLTDLEARDATPERIAAFFRAVNASAAPHPLAANRYSLSAAELERAARDGGRAAVARYALDPRVLEAMESGGRVPVPGDATPLARVVPALLRRTPAGRCEMGLNFGGNHFLEVQVVDAVRDRGLAARWGLVPGRVVVTYHLGPGPFSSTLLHFYTRRKALEAARVPFFFLGKLAFHAGALRRARVPAARDSLRGALGRVWSLHFRRNGATPIAPGSEAGLHFRQALAMATNFGFAYRLATVAAIRDALHETFHAASQVRLLCDISHNSLGEESYAGTPAWVARHNACRRAPGRPALVAGAHDVPSYLALANPGGPPEIHSYDHGVGCVIEDHRRRGLAATRDATLRLTLARGGSGAVRGLEILPVRDARPIERVLDRYQELGSLARIVRLRPLGTLKNG